MEILVGHRVLIKYCERGLDAFLVRFPELQYLLVMERLYKNFREFKRQLARFWVSLQLEHCHLLCHCPIHSTVAKGYVGLSRDYPSFASMKIETRRRSL